MPNLIDSLNTLAAKLDRVSALMPIGQATTITLTLAIAPEAEGVLSNVLAISDIIETLPGPFGQKNLADQSIAYLHYRCAYGDFYVTERGNDSQLTDLYGVIVNDDGQFFGYISTKALFAADGLLDMDFRPTKVADIVNAVETTMLLTA